MTTRKAPGSPTARGRRRTTSVKSSTTATDAGVTDQAAEIATGAAAAIAGESRTAAPLAEAPLAATPSTPEVSETEAPEVKPTVTPADIPPAEATPVEAEAVDSRQPEAAETAPVSDAAPVAEPAAEVEPEAPAVAPGEETAVEETAEKAVQPAEASAPKAAVSATPSLFDAPAAPAASETPAVSETFAVSEAPAETEAPIAAVEVAPEEAASEETAPEEAAAPAEAAPEAVLSIALATTESFTHRDTEKPSDIAHAGLGYARQSYAALHEQSELWTKGFSSTLSVASRGVTELNGKVFDLVRSQTDGTLDLWRQLLKVTSLAEAVEVQTRELRRQFESTSHQLKDIAQTSNRLLSETFSRIQTRQSKSDDQA